MPYELPKTASQGDARHDSTEFTVRAESPEIVEQKLKFPEIPGFVVESIIARGGMGVVYLAVDLQLNRRVAIKTMPIDKPFAPTQKERFDREVASLAELHHPNVVQLYRIGSVDERPFMVLEYVRGTDLGQTLRTGPLPFQSAAVITEKIATAIEFTHSFNILHRDLTPSNVLIGVVTARDLIELSIAETSGSLCEHIHDVNFDFSEIELKVSDFGLAQLEFGDEQLTRTGGVSGTPGYLAPEAIDSKFGNVATQTDIYGLGAILYAMLTGRAPFVASSISESFSQVMNSEVLSPSVLRPNVCPDLQTICLKCLEKHSKDRYQSATELLIDLRRYLNGQDILARPPSVWRRGHDWVRKNQSAVLLSAGMVLIGVTLSIAGAIQNYHLGKQQEQQEETSIIAASEKKLELIESRLTSEIKVVKNLGALLTCQNEIDRETFELFCSAISNDHNSMVSLEWLPRITQAERASHEEQGKQEYGKNYVIRWQSEDGKMVPAGESRDYFPVFFVEPLDQNRQAIGFDVADEMTRSSALKKAMETSEVTITSKIQLVQDHESSSVLAFMPVYYLTDSDSAEVSLPEIRGFAGGVFRIERFVRPVLADAGINGGIIIYDVTNSPQKIFASENSQLNNEPFGYERVRLINIGSRLWELHLFLPNDQYSRSNKMLPGYLFTIGILATMLVAGLPLIFAFFHSENRIAH